MGEEIRQEAKSTLSLPPGMARADDPEQIAALDSEKHKQRVRAIYENASDEDGLTSREAYHLKLVAYRSQLRHEQLQLKLREQELEQERRARIEAEKQATELRRERRREAIYIQHHSVHAYQRNLNDEFWRQQRLLKALENKQECAGDSLP